MATITFNGQLQPSTVRGTAAMRRRRDAARTREMQRVYRRRRVGLMAAVATIFVVAGLSVFSLFGSSAAADGNIGRAAAPKFVVAQSGDTLWSIGQRIAPNAAITEVVDELVRLNGTTIQTGQLVRIP
jgi:nucleoid-associated protein YgaU